MSSPLPLEVRRDPATRVLRIRWDDGVDSVLGYDLLRGFCPCAACQGHLVRELVYRPPRRPADPVQIQPVGNYAISIAWSDGHATGIYRFDFLRELAARPAMPPAAGEP